MINNATLLLNGLFITLILTLSSIVIGLFLAITLTLCRLSQYILIKKISNYIVLFICGTPLLVQIFLIYFGVGQFEWIRQSWVWIILREPMACAIIALSINTACYTSQLLKGAIQSVPQNEKDACSALGMPKWLALRRVILPRAFRIAVPAYSNEVMMILKSTSLASTITLLDLMGVTQQLISQTYETVSWYMVAGVIYLILNIFILAIFRRLKKWSQIPSQKTK